MNRNTRAILGYLYTEVQGLYLDIYIQKYRGCTRYSDIYIQKYKVYTWKCIYRSIMFILGYLCIEVLGLYSDAYIDTELIDYNIYITKGMSCSYVNQRVVVDWSIIVVRFD